MRILLVSANYRPSVGGIERFVEVLAHLLAERGHEVTVAACRTHGAPLSENDGSVRVVRIRATNVLRDRLGVPYPLPAPASAVRTLRTLIRGSDVVHVQDALYATSAMSLVLARRLGVPTVLTQHVGFVPQGRVALDAVQRAGIATIGRTARLAGAVTTVNTNVAEWVRETWGIENVRPFPVGVHAPSEEASDRIAVRRELGLDGEAFVALFSGRDVPKKRLDVFLGATDPAYRLVAVTDRRGADERATFVPFLPPDRFARLLQAADAFVLPSEGEGFPLSLAEALLAGLPCVVTREPGYERYLEEGDVVYVEPDPAAVRAALVRLASDPAHRAELAERARAAGRRSFTVDGFVEAYERLYDEVAGAVS